MQAQIYQPLNPGTKEIRLVTIVAGSFHDDIKLRLTRTSLEDKPTFEAISYAWGDPNITKGVNLDDYPFEVTTNLEAALRHLRLETENRTFWIDAVCVNQKDLPERSSQVQLMRDIYTECSGCVIWLGEEGHETADAIATIEYLASGMHFYDWPTFSSMFAGTKITHLEPGVWREYLKRHPSGFSSLAVFMRRSWWTRAWVLQEFVLPSAVKFMCGHRVFTRETITTAQKRLHDHTSCCAAIWAEIKLAEKGGTSLNPIAALDSIHHGYRSKTQTLSLMDLLSAMWTRDCSDPRDKVYAVLGLVSPDPNNPIVTSYDIEVSDVYTDTVRYQIEKSKSLEILGLNFKRDSRSNHFDVQLPSWVPDLSVRQSIRDVQERRRKRYKLFRASRGTPFQGNVLYGKILKLTGIHYGTVLNVGIFTERWTENVLRAKVWIQDMLNETDSTSFLRVIMRDCHRENGARKYRRSQPQDYSLWKEWLSDFEKRSEPDFLPTNSLYGTPHDVIYQSFRYAFKSKCLFITENGNLGLGPRETRIGDEVWIASGGNMPLMLRRTDQIHDSHTCHTFISESFVDGIMDGEAATDFEAQALEIFIS